MKAIKQLKGLATAVLLVATVVLILPQTLLPENRHGTPGTAGFAAPPPEDTIPPVIICPSDSSLMVNGPQVIDYSLPVVTDDSGDTLVPVLVSGLAPGSVFPVGTTINTWSATDSAGNTSTCSFSITLMLNMTGVLQYDGSSSQMLAPQGGLHCQRSFYLIRGNELQQAELNSGDQINSIGFIYGIAQDAEVNGNLKVYLENTEDSVSRIDTSFRYMAVSGTSMQLSHLFPGDYEWQVKSVCSGSDTWSEVAVFSTPDSNKCNQPYNLASANLTSSSTTLQWEAPYSAGFTSYQLEYKMIEDANWQSTTTATTSYYLSGLIPGKNYMWRVKSLCGDESPSASSSFLVPQPEVCTVPSNPAFTVLTDTSVQFQWTGAAPDSLYYVEYRRKGTNEWTQFITKNHSLTIKSFIPGTSYEWKVASRCSTGVGTVNGTDFTTTGSAMCYAPVNLKVSAVGDSTATLIWPSTTPAATYVVKYRLKDAISWDHARQGMTLVSNDSLVLPAGTGRFDIPFSPDSGFIYTGNGLYVALEYSNQGGISSFNTALCTKQGTSVRGSNGADSLNFILSFNGRTDTSSTFMPPVLKATDRRPVTYFGSGSFNDQVEVAAIYTIGHVALPYTNEVPVKALIRNMSQTAVIYPVTLAVYDANTGAGKYSAVVNKTIQGMSHDFVTFNGWWPGQLSADSVVVSVPTQTGEVNITNNHLYILQKSGMSVVSYDDNTPALTGAGTGTGGGMIMVKYSMKGCGKVEKAIAYLYPTATGHPLKAFLLNASGDLLDSSMQLVPDTSLIHSWYSFKFPSAPSLKDEDYYVAIRQSASVTPYTPVGVQWEGPQPRAGAYYRAAYDGTVITDTPLPGRLMIRAGIKPSIPVPFISGSTVLCSGATNTLQAAGKTTRFADEVIYVTSEFSDSEQALGAPDVYPEYQAGSYSWTNTIKTDTNARDKIILSFTEPAPVNYIDIYETFNPGAVDSVFIMNGSGNWVQVYAGNARELPPVSRINHIAVSETGYNVSQVKISLHSGKYGKNHAIDAVAIGQQYDPAIYSTYSWTPGGASQSISASATGQYKLTVTNAQGCSWSDSIVLQTPPAITAPVISFEGLLQFCTGDTSVILTSDKTTGIEWSTGDSTASIEVTESGNYTVTYNDGCNTATSAGVAVTVNPLPIPSTSGGAICEGVPAILSCQEEYASYEWSTMPVQTTQSVSVTVPKIYYLTVTDDNGCTGTMPVNAFMAPIPDPVISGKPGFCPGGATELDAGGGFYTYSWSTGSASQTTWVNTEGTVSVTVSNSYGCLGTDELAVAAYPVPSPAISGTTSLCQGNTTTLDAGGGYTSYLWSTGVKSRYITVDTAGYFTVTVKDLNECIGSSSVETNMDGALPEVPGLITGPVKGICNMNGIEYSVQPMDNTSHYVWTVPGGMEITSGQGSTNITVNAGTSGGWLTVAASNTCGQSPTWNGRKVWLDCTPAMPGAIVGPTSSVCGLSLVSYYINDVFGASAYDWTAPVGASIVSGDGSAWVTVAFSSTFTSGDLCVIAQNSCGNSQTRCLHITGAPPQAGTITGPVTVCRKEKNVAYSVMPLTNVSNYLWTVPMQAAIISGQGTPSIVVNFGNNSGNITVQAANNCGTGQVQSKAVNVQQCKSGEPLLVYYDPSSYGYPGWNFAWGQQVFNPEVFASAGDYSIGSTATISWTIGEPVSGTIGDDVSLLSQGFQQGAFAFTTGNNPADNFMIEAFPVPAKEFVNIRITSAGQPNLLIQLYDVLGNEVFRDVSEASIYNHRVPVSEYSTGMMLLKVTDTSNHQHKTFRIIKL